MPTFSLLWAHAWFIEIVFIKMRLLRKYVCACIFILFVDLSKAYDSVPRKALWCALRKYGVPDCLIDLVRSFHISHSVLAKSL